MLLLRRAHKKDADVVRCYGVYVQTVFLVMFDNFISILSLVDEVG